MYPTRRAIILAACGVPAALLAVLGPPGFWLLGGAWVGTVVSLLLIDWYIGASSRYVQLNRNFPDSLGLGAEGEAVIDARFTGITTPRTAEFFLETNERVDAEPQSCSVSVHGDVARAVFPLRTIRRGPGAIRRLWVRWQGPMGLVWKQLSRNFDAPLPIVLNTGAVKDEALRLYMGNPIYGENIQFNIGDGAEFHALTEFQSGMNRLAIDWKQSARHGMLLAREYREERNQQIMFALDCGRLMCEPVEGTPRIDCALRATLLLSFVGLKLGDRVGLFAFDAVPRLSSGTVAGVSAYPVLQRLAADVDYSHEETNYTLGLSQLAGELPRRSLVVIFTEFADTVSAELMLENIGRLLRRHLVLFVAFRDQELEDMVNSEPMSPDDVSRAVIADQLLRQREIVVGQLRRMGVHIVEAPAARMGMALLNKYLDLKRRDLL